MVKRTKLIPCPNVLQHGRLIEFLKTLFDQVGQLSTNPYLQRWPGTGSCKVNSNAVEQRGATTLHWSDLIRNRVEALCRAVCHPASSTIMLRTQVKNNLSWLLSGFALKYWAISIKLCASHLEEQIWHPGTGREALEWQSHKVPSSVVEESQMQFCRSMKETGSSCLIQFDMLKHIFHKEY